MKTSFTQKLLIVLFVCSAGWHTSNAQALLGTSWRASDAFARAYSSTILSGVLADSMTMKFGYANVWELIYYSSKSTPDSIITEKGTWTQIDATHFSIVDTLSSSPFNTMHVCSDTAIDTQTYSIVKDTLILSDGHGGCSIRESLMEGDWYGPTLPSLSVNNALPQHTLQIYPNPVADVIYIQAINGLTGGKPVRITLYDMTGRVVRQESLSAAATISLQGLQALQAGIYNLVTEQNGVKEHFKIVKQ